MSNSVLFCDLQRPLTVGGYLKNSPIGALTNIVTGANAGVGASVGAGGGNLTNTVAGALAVANVVITALIKA
jgi:hypothetical protein